MSSDSFVLTEAAQVRALASPIRAQIMDLLREGEEKSVADLAAAIGASGPSIQYHIGILLKAGVVVSTGKRRTNQRSEAVYRAISKKMRIAVGPTSPEYDRALLALALASLRKLEKEITKAYDHRTAGPKTRLVTVKTRVGAVRAEDLPRIQFLLDEALNLVRPRIKGSDDPVVSVRAFVVNVDNDR